MKADHNHLNPFHRPEPPRRRTNPYEDVPTPKALDGNGLRAPEIFRERPLAAHLQRNAEWLRTRPRTSDGIEAALFPECDLGGMEPEEVRSLLNRALWNAGYTPNNPDSDNPTWHWLEGEPLHDHKEGRA